MINRLFIPILIIACLSFSTAVFGQYQALEQEGEKLFNSGKYSQALLIYHQLDSISPQNLLFLFRKGICQLNKPEGTERSLETFLMLKERDPGYPELNFYLGKAHALNYKLNEAVAYFNFFLKENITIQQKETSIREIECAENAMALMNNKIDVVFSKPFQDNTTREFNPGITADEASLFFTYNGDKSKGGLQDSYLEPDSAGDYFDDVFVSHKKAGNWLSPESVGNKVNTNQNDRFEGISPDGQILYVSRTTPRDRGDIYECRMETGGWSTPQKMNGNINTADWEGGISVSGDGNTIYFASERSGGVGGKDIYRSVKQSNGEWGPAENLGPSINSYYNEERPFFHLDDHTLFFISDGHNSMGGSDVFISTLIGDAWKKPYNIGFPVNSVFDETSFSVSGDGQRGFFSSTRPGVYGKDLMVVSPAGNGFQPKILVITGMLQDESKPFFTSIKIIDNQTGKPFGEYSSNPATGKYTVTLPRGKEYKINFDFKGKGIHSEIVNLTRLNNFIEINKDLRLSSADPAKNTFEVSSNSEWFQEQINRRNKSDSSKTGPAITENPVVDSQMALNTGSGNKVDAAQNAQQKENKAPGIKETPVENKPAETISVVANPATTEAPAAVSGPFTNEDYKKGNIEPIVSAGDIQKSSIDSNGSNQKRATNNEMEKGSIVPAAYSMEKKNQEPAPSVTNVQNNNAPGDNDLTGSENKKAKIDSANINQETSTTTDREMSNNSSAQEPQTSQPATGETSGQGALLTVEPISSPEGKDAGLLSTDSMAIAPPGNITQDTVSETAIIIKGKDSDLKDGLLFSRSTAFKQVMSKYGIDERENVSYQVEIYASFTMDTLDFSRIYYAGKIELRKYPNGIYRYTVGEFNTLSESEATKVKITLNDPEFPDAFTTILQGKERKLVKQFYSDLMKQSLGSPPEPKHAENIGTIIDMNMPESAGAPEFVFSDLPKDKKHFPGTNSPEVSPKSKSGPPVQNPLNEKKQEGISSDSLQDPIQDIAGTNSGNKSAEILKTSSDTLPLKSPSEMPAVAENTDGKPEQVKDNLLSPDSIALTTPSPEKSIEAGNVTEATTPQSSGAEKILADYQKLPVPEYFEGKDLNIKKFYNQLLERCGKWKSGEIIYTVQIGAYRFPQNFKYPNLNEFGSAEIIPYPDGITRFTMKTFETLERAEEFRQSVISKGTKDAWVTAIHKGKRMLLQELIRNNFFQPNQG